MSAQDNFNFDLVGGREKPFAGYVSSVDKTAVNERVMVRGSKNMWKPERGTYAVREGLKRRGTADATIAGVLSAFTWNTSLATIRPLRVSNNKLQVESDIADGSTLVWYDLQDATGFEDYVFDTWWDNTLKKDSLLFVRGDDNTYMWQGGIGLVSSTTGTTIILTDPVATQGFDNVAGSVVINGNTYAYTGSSGSTLTGVTPDPTGEAANSVVVSAIVTTTDSPAADFQNDFIKVINNRLHVGSYTSRLIYIADQSDYTDFTFSTPRVPGEGELLTLDSLAKGIGVRVGQAHIFGGTQDLYIVNYQDITVGSTLTQQTTVDKKTMADLESALQHNFIANVGDDLIWLSQDQELKIYGTFRNLNSPVFPTLSLPVKQELQAQDFTGGSLTAIGEFVYITAPNSGAVWLYQTHYTVTELGNVSTERLWHSPFIWNLSRIVEIESVVYGYSNANPQTYQMWNTLQWHDDSPSDDPLPYVCILAMAYRQKGNRANLLNGEKYYIEGYMSPGSEVNSAIVLDYQGATGLQSTILNGPDNLSTFFSGNVGLSLGDSSLGDSPLGEGVSEVMDDQENLPKFRSIIDTSLGDCFEYQLRVYSSAVDSQWEVLALGLNAEKSTRKPVFIRKS